MARYNKVVMPMLNRLLLIIGLVCVFVLGGCNNGNSNITTSEVKSEAITTTSKDVELKNVEKLIHDKKHQEALDILTSSSYRNSYSEYEVLIDYTIALKEDNGNVRFSIDPTILSLIEIPDNYSGFMSKEIKEYMNKYNHLITEKRNDNSKSLTLVQAVNSTKANTSTDSSPSIGMTAEQVVKSSWGKPIDINKTTTANGYSEQWVYNGKYIYFENGIVTTIQE